MGTRAAPAKVMTRLTIMLLLPVLFSMCGCDANAAPATSDRLGDPGDAGDGGVALVGLTAPSVTATADTWLKVSTAQSSTLPPASRCAIRRGETLILSRAAAAAEGGHLAVALAAARPGCVLRSGYLYGPHVRVAGGDTLPHDGISRGRVAIPRRGLANPTLRRALGVAVEPDGELVTYMGSSYVAGRVSWFGGPRDTGVTASETGAITGERLRSLNTPMSPSSGDLASRPEDFYYVAMRWDYSEGGRSFWRDTRLLVVNPDSGTAVVVRPVDWGPNTSTRRILDLSPQALRDLGLTTDDRALVAFAAAGTPLGRVAR
jgi:hypothetical protein